MLETRIIPCLLLKNKGLVKTIKFKNPIYLGDPRNVVKIFNEKEVDELIILDITATVEKRKPDFDLIREIVSEAFIPICYGGGIRSVEDVKTLFRLGVEKVSINSYAFENHDFIKELAKIYGSQSIVVSIDIKKNLLGKYGVYIYGGRKKTNIDPISYAMDLEKNGVGEILINSIDKDGTMSGYDKELVKEITQAVSIPVIACGGAGSLNDILDVVNSSNVSAVAAGSIFVYQGVHKAVLISYPSQEEIKDLFYSHIIKDKNNGS